MIPAKDFIKMVRENRTDMDDHLEKIYNDNMTRCSEKAYNRAFSLFSRQREFAKQNLCKFFEEWNIIREKIAATGSFGDELDRKTMIEYIKDSNK